jgi:endonuclease-8
MPEVMEIRKYADLINKYLKNQIVTNIVIKKGRYHKHGAFEGFSEFKKALPNKLIEVKTKGKFIYMEFTNNIYLLSTLGLSGGWAFLPKNTDIYRVPKLLEFIDGKDVEDYLIRSLDHINVEITFEIGTLVFFDMLSFGTIKVINNKTELDKKLNTIGPDIMDITTDFTVFKNRIVKPVNKTKSIGTVITNQKLISGVGNYIRADALWLSQIDPFRKVSTLSADELSTLFHSLKVITWGNYNRKFAIKNKIIKKSDKTPADYKRDFFVYREEKDIHGNKVIKEELFEGSQKRFIYWCKGYQK